VNRRAIVALFVLAGFVPAIHGLPQASPAPAQAASGPALQAPARPTRPTGIVVVPKLEKPKGARRLTEKDFGGYLLVYFKDQTQSAYFAISRDGYTFTDVNEGQPVFDGTLLAEQKGVRDPHIARGPDGAFYLAMTDLHIFAQRLGYRATQWERPQEQYGWGNNRAIVMMKSWDLVHWTHAIVRMDKLFPDMGDISAFWAPEIIYDEQAGKMMVYFTVRYGPQDDCHLYYAYADEAFTTLVTKPVRIAETTGIDGDITQAGDRFHLFYASGAKVKHAVSNRINQGYQFEDRRIDPETVNTEGPNVFKRFGTNTYVLMYDVFGLRPSNMGFSETTDFVTFTNIGRFNEGVMKTTNFTGPKHAAVTYLTPAELEAAAAHWNVRLNPD
jgi:hypothetical protein